MATGGTGVGPIRVSGGRGGTGGTAPGVRPPGVNKAPAAQRYLNKASNRMETPEQMKEYRSRAANNVNKPVVVRQHAQPITSSQPHSSVQHTAQKNVSHAEHQTHAKNESEWNEKEARQHIGERVKGEIAAETKPFNEKAGQIAGSEAASAARYRGFTNEAETAEAGIVANQQAGAKTTDNQAAENVIKASEPTVTAGNNVATQNGGYVAPQVQAALQAGVASTAGIASAAQGKALTQGQNEEDYLRNLNAQATQRYVAGQGQLTESFDKSRQANANEEAKVVARGAGATAKDLEAFNSRQTNTRLAEDKLRSEGVKLHQGQEKVEHEGKKIGNEGTKIKNTAKYENELIAKDKETNSIAHTKNEADRVYKEGQIRNGAQKLKNEQEKISRLPLSSAQIKYNNELASAYNGIRQVFAAEKEGGKKLSPAESKKALEIAKEQLSIGKEGKKPFPKAVNPILVKAAEELFYTHKVGTSTKAEMQRLGIPVNYNIWSAVSGQ